MPEIPAPDPAPDRAEFGRNGLLDKLHAGDGATPEGRYRVKAKNARSRFHRALLIDYPNAEDLVEFAAARRDGRISAGRFGRRLARGQSHRMTVLV